MPFYWRRRNRWWYGSRYKRRNLYKRRKTYWPRRRRKPRRFARRRRRRRRKTKVRRKRKTLPLRQWQPDSIRKCKIKGSGFLIAGADGNQIFCYTDQKCQYTQPKAPGGGGFGCELFTLQYLYHEWESHKNIWTATNDYKDLCRYTGCKISLYRHPEIDFIVNFDRQPPFQIKKDTYYNIHPQLMLLKKHKRIIPSLKTNPLGKRKITLKIKPPKQMINKWFFQEQFTNYGLLQLNGTSCSLTYSLYGPNTQSPNITIWALNPNFYKRQNWAQHSSGPWLPYLDFPQTTKVEFQTLDKKKYSVTLNSYYSTIQRDTGFFQPGVLQAVDVFYNTVRHGERPTAIGRYNPEEDSGIGNKVYFLSLIHI